MVSECLDDFFSKKELKSDEDIFNENINLAYKIFQRYSGKINMDPEDFLQECFIFLWKAIENYSPDKGALSTLVFSLARNWVCDYFKNSKTDAINKKVIIEDDSVQDKEAINYIGYEVDYFENILEDEIKNKIISTLGVDYENTLLYNKLRLEGFSKKEIKQKLNLSEKELESIKYRKKILRQKRDSFQI